MWFWQAHCSPNNNRLVATQAAEEWCFRIPVQSWCWNSQGLRSVVRAIWRCLSSGAPEGPWMRPAAWRNSGIWKEGQLEQMMGLSRCVYSVGMEASFLPGVPLLKRHCISWAMTRQRWVFGTCDLPPTSGGCCIGCVMSTFWNVPVIALVLWITTIFDLRLSVWGNKYAFR